MNDKRSEIGEAILGLVLGIPAAIFGYSLFVGSCNFIGPGLPSLSECRLVGSNFGLAGIVLLSIGVLTVVGSIAVLIGRKTLRTPPGQGFENSSSVFLCTADLSVQRRHSGIVEARG
jgi:uncharacterized membrane protein YphA (DoxX/SURF4 family)